jgi:hypothetical protein
MNCRTTLHEVCAGLIMTSLAVQLMSCAPTRSNRQVDPRQAERVQRLMAPLIQNMNKPLQLKEVRVRILEDSQINAAYGGSGEFYVTTALADLADDERLRGHLAYVIASADLWPSLKADSPKSVIAADAHAIEILERSGFNGKRTMEKSLIGLLDSQQGLGGSSGTHPTTKERLQKINELVPATNPEPS